MVVFTGVLGEIGVLPREKRNWEEYQRESPGGYLPKRITASKGRRKLKIRRYREEMLLEETLISWEAGGLLASAKPVAASAVIVSLRANPRSYKIYEDSSMSKKST